MATFNFSSNITGGTLSALSGTLTITTNTPPTPPTFSYKLTNNTVCPVSNFIVGPGGVNFQITYNGNQYTFSGKLGGFQGSVNGPTITGETDNWTASSTSTEGEEGTSKQAGYSSGS